MDLMNKRFTRWLVIDFDAGKSNIKNKYWICKCDCGTIKSVSESNLISGKSKSCGCLHNELLSKNRFKDLTGMRFYRLIVLMLDIKKTKEKGGKSYWICKCDCGTIKSINGSDLVQGKIKSCGCLNRELTISRNESKIKSNRIEFDTNLGCLRVYFNNSDEYFLCDVEDRDIAEKYCWYKGSDGYVHSNKRGSGISVLFHRLVLEKYYGDLTGYVIDHHNHNVSDNRRCNLRKCTQSENCINRRITSNTKLKYIHYKEKSNTYTFNFRGRQIAESKDLNKIINIRDNYLIQHPSNFYYDESKDYINKNNPNVIYPFSFISQETIIKPFKFINK